MILPPATTYIHTLLDSDIDYDDDVDIDMM